MIFAFCDMNNNINNPLAGAVDMVFSANSAIVMNNKALIAHMAVEPRRKESPHYAQWFKDNGFEVEELGKIVIQTLDQMYHPGIISSSSCRCIATISQSC